MTTSISRSHSRRHAICWSAAAACLLAFQPHAWAGPADVTAVVNDNGTLEIKRASGTSGNEGSFFVGIRLEGGPEDISVFVSDGPDYVLLDTFSTIGDADYPPISAIDVDADQCLVEFGHQGLFQFDGDISVDVRTGGLCELSYLGMTGDLTLSGSSGRIAVEYRFASVGGDVTLVGGPGHDGFYPWLVSYSGAIFVGGNLHIDGGPGNEFILLANAFVSHDTLIDLGQSSNAGGIDADDCELYYGELCGSVMISGDEGDDSVFLHWPTIGGDFLVDLGNGADRLSIFGLHLVPCAEDQPTPMLFLDGGNGNSDELFVYYFEIFADEYTGFETVTIP